MFGHKPDTPLPGSQPDGCVLPPPQFTTRPTRRATISLTPLIDVVFILLVFFMLASSFLDWRAIQLDAPGRSTAGSAMDGALLIEIRSDGLRLSGATVTPEMLDRRVAEHLERDPDRRILIRPASGVALQNAVAIIDRLTAAGAHNLSLVRDH